MQTGPPTECHESQAAPRRHAWLRFMLGDVNLRACAVFTLVMLVMPSEGLGFDLCASRYYSDSPCPGCGMTRSGSNLVRGQFTRALQYHPFGPVLLPIIAAFGLLALVPRRWRQAVRESLIRRARLLRPLYLAGLTTFLGFGVVRWCLVLVGWWAFPSTWP